MKCERFVEVDAVTRHATTGPARAGQEAQPFAALHLDRLLAGATPDTHHPAVDLRVGLDELHHADEMLETGAELMRRVNLQAFVQNRQTGELAGLQNGTLAVLAADEDAHLERRPLVVSLLSERLLEAPRLPVVEDQAGR